MPASETVTPIDLSSAPPRLARMARLLHHRLSGDARERLVELVERIAPDAADPADLTDVAYRWFVDEHLRRWLAAIGLTWNGEFGTAYTWTASAWSAARREVGSGWLAAFDQGADAIWRSGAGAVWDELAGYRAQAAPGWDAAAFASKVVAAGRGRHLLEDVVAAERASVLDLFERLVEVAR